MTESAPTTKAEASEPTLNAKDLRAMMEITAHRKERTYIAPEALEPFVQAWEASDAATRAALKAQNDDWKRVHVLLLDADTTDMGIKKDRAAIRKWISEATKIAEKNCPDHKSDSKLSALAGEQEGTA